MILQIIKIAWRNLWRNPGRSGVLLAAIIAGVWAGVTVSAVSNGFINQRFERLVNEVSHIQIHHPEYRDERETSMFIRRSDQIKDFLEMSDSVEIFSARALADGIIQSPVTSSGVMVRGIDPGREDSVTSIRNLLSEGEYLDSDVRNPLFIGQKLAEKLQAEVGMRLVITFQNSENELTSAAFNVTGIYSTPSPLAERLVYTRLETLQPYLHETPVYHEIAILLKNNLPIGEFTQSLNAAFPEAEALSWHELSPELRLYTDIGNQATYYIMIVIMLALAFGILNTMLMAIFERTRELGMLMAVGMNRLKVFMMICIESLLITMTGAISGMALSALVIRYFYLNGLDMSEFSEGLAEFGYDAVINPSLPAESMIGVALLVAITAILASVYPAYKAIRLQPADAVRE